MLMESLKAYIKHLGFLAQYDIAIQGTNLKITNSLQLSLAHKPAEDIEK